MFPELRRPVATLLAVLLLAPGLVVRQPHAGAAGPSHTLEAAPTAGTALVLEGPASQDYCGLEGGCEDGLCAAAPTCQAPAFASATAPGVLVTTLASLAGVADAAPPTRRHPERPAPPPRG